MRPLGMDSVMQPLSDADLLRVWELGQPRAAWQRALLMLAPALPWLSQGQLADLSLGQRNAYLFLLRQQSLGSTLEALAVCPRCRLKVEFSFQVADVCPAIPEARPLSPQTALFGDVEVQFRPITSRDLAAASSPSCRTTRDALVDRAIVQATRAGLALEIGSLSPELLAAVGEQIREADPLAEIRFQMDCPACHMHWAAAFDIAAFLWIELSRLARTLFEDIHRLASAYGWREADIMSLSTQRRRAYLDLLGT